MTHIGPSIHITGDVSGDDDLTIHGRITGTVTLRDHAVVIAADARLDADVRGQQVVIHGEVAGAVAAGARIELSPSARVIGSLSANRIVIHDGALFCGLVDMNQRTIAARLASYRAAHSA